MPDEPPVCRRLGGGQLELAARLVVAIGPEVRDRAPRRGVGALPAVAAPHLLRGAPQVVGGVVGTEIGAVAEHRAVLHEPVVEEDLLAALDVALGVEDLALGVDHALGNRRLGLIGAVREQAKDEEADQHDEDDGLHPGLRNEQAPAFSGHASPSVVECEAAAL